MPDGRKIYFLTNQQDTEVKCVVSFRVTDYAPEWWNPVTGDRRPLTEYSVENGYTVVQLAFEAAESGFVVFKDKKQKIHLKINVA